MELDIFLIPKGLNINNSALYAELLINRKHNPERVEFIINISHQNQCHYLLIIV